MSEASQTRRDAADARRDAADLDRAAGDARRDAGEVRREAGEVRRASDKAAAASENRFDSAAKAVQTAAAETSAQEQATEPGKPAGKTAEAVPVAPAATPKLDMAALVSIAMAAQAENQTAEGAKTAEVRTAEAKTGEAKTGEAKTDGAKSDGAKSEAAKADAATTGKPEGDVNEGQAGAVTESKAEGVAVALVAPAVVLAPPVPVPTLPTGLAAGAPGETAGEGDLLSGRAGSAAGAAALSLLAARETKAASTAGANPAGAAAAVAVAAGASSGDVAGTMPGSRTSVSSPAGTLPLPVGADQAAPSDAPPDTADTLAQLQALTQAHSPAAAQASGPVESRPVDALQQALNPIDLSALGQQGGNRVEPLRILTGPEQTAQAPAATQSQNASASPPTPLHVLPIEIGLRALAGARQFDIRLDPGELGRVDVNLSISDKGEVTARMVVDRVETLHLLQRDARTLERAFEQAGLKPSEAGVDITLRDPSDQSGFRQNRQQDEAPQRARIFANGSETGDDSTISIQPAPARRFVRLGGVDLSI